MYAKRKEEKIGLKWIERQTNHTSNRLKLRKMRRVLPFITECSNTQLLIKSQTVVQIIIMENPINTMDVKVSYSHAL